jgi:hypothetical protein
VTGGVDDGGHVAASVTVVLRAASRLMETVFTNISLRVVLLFYGLRDRAASRHELELKQP